MKRNRRGGTPKHVPYGARREGCDCCFKGKASNVRKARERQKAKKEIREALMIPYDICDQIQYKTSIEDVIIKVLWAEVAKSGIALD